MGKLKDKRWPYIVLSILLATALWAYIRSQGDTDGSKTLDRVAVTFSGIEVLEGRGLMLASGEDMTVTVHVKGPWNTMNRITRNTVSAEVDLSRITEPGEYSLPYDVIFSDQTVGVSVQNKEPRELLVTVANYAEKDIEVQTVFNGSVADGFQTGKIVVSPESIHISGEAELVEQVQYARVVIDGDGLSKTVTGDYPYELIGPADEPLNADTLERSAEAVFVTMPVVTTRDIPLTVEVIPGGGATVDDINLDINPKVISVSGEPEDVESLKQIVLGSVDLSEVVNTGIYTFNITLPSALTNVSEVSTATVTITFRGLSSKVVTVNNIELINVPEGYSATAVTQSKDVLVRGTKEAVDKITPSHVRLTVDLSNAPTATGRYTVEAAATLEGVADAGAVGDYTIVVSLTR